MKSAMRQSKPGLTLVEIVMGIIMLVVLAAIAIGTGYSPAGYAFNSNQTNATGTGPRSAVREIEIQAEYGPVAQ